MTAYRLRRTFFVLLVLLLASVSLAQTNVEPAPKDVESQAVSIQQARTALAKLPTKGKAPKTGYSRQQFGNGWATVGGCDMREIILKRDMKDVAVNDKCEVMVGKLNDPYTGKIIEFSRGAGTSNAVQIDHVVPLANAWQTGAFKLSSDERIRLANDPLELLAVDGPANERKSDGDAATWLPPNKPFRCQYVSRQVSVKNKYHLWVTPAEHDAIERILERC